MRRFSPRLEGDQSLRSACSLTLSCSERKRAFPGVTCPNDSARGSQPSIVSPTGPSEASGSTCSTLFKSRSTRLALSSMPRSFAPIRSHRVVKGDPGQRFGSFTRWLLDENPRRRRHAWQADPCPANPRTTTRGYRCGGTSGPRTGYRTDRGHRLRLRQLHRRYQEAPHACCHLSPSLPQSQTATGPQALSASISG